MKIPTISNLVRIVLLRGLLRLGRFVLNRSLAPALRPAPASTGAPHRAGTTGRVIDGEFRRVDPRHNNSW